MECRFYKSFKMIKRVEGTDIYYETKLFLKSINRRVKFVIDHDVLDEQIDEFIYSINQKIEDHKSQLSEILLTDASIFIKQDFLEEESEIKFLMDIKNEEEVLNYLSYNEIRLFKNNEVVIKTRSEWDAYELTLINFKVEEMIVLKKGKVLKSGEIDKSLFTQLK